MAIAVLGPLEVDGTASGMQQRDRVVLAVLALRPGVVQAPDVLADALWGDRPPASWAKVVQGCVVRLRKRLGTTAITTASPGYRLTVHGEDLDHVRFERLVERAREALAGGEPDRARYLLEEALRLWRGAPFPELGEWPPAQADVEHLVELHESAREALLEATIGLGHRDEALAEAVRLVREAPFRERRWGLLALAQYRAGRQQEALASLQRARTVLVEELGLDPGPELTALERSILAQDPALDAGEPLPEPQARCPYPGLVAYDVEDAARFHGRAAEVAACLRRLDEAGVLAVVGPSGIGKSSVVRAGLAATLSHEGRRVVVMTPGRRPCESLAAASVRPGDVLVVDQLEEALGPEVAEDERSTFFSALREHFGRGSLVVSLRADRLGDLTPHPELTGLVERGLVLLGPMAPADLREAIEGPAREAGLRVEPGLVDLLVAEVEGEPGALPLLSHVLRATWEHREGPVLTLEGYHRSGGVRHAVARTAEAAYRDLDPAAQGAVRNLMVRLVAPGPDGTPVPTRLPVRSLPSDAVHTEVVERLLRARLLGSDGQTVVVAHEALVRAWPRLRSWLDDDVDGQRIMRHLAVTADSWDELGRPDSELYRGVRQARAAEWRARSGASLTDVERDFLEASAELADREQQATEAQVRRERRLNQRLRLGLAAVAVLLAVALVAGALASTAARRADREASAADREARAADARRLGAEALQSDELDRSLLLAAAGVSLDDSLDTRNNLLATLAKGPALAASVRAPSTVFGMAVEPTAGQVVTTLGGGSSAFYDAGLRPAAGPERLGAVAVVASPDGRHLAVTTRPDLVEKGEQPPIVLLMPSGERSAVQLGGFPEGYHTWNSIGFSPNGRWLATTMRDLRGKRPLTTVVWDLRRPGRPVAALQLEAGSAPTVSNDGRALYTTGGGTLQVTDLPTGHVRTVLRPEDLAVRTIDEAMVQSPDGRTLAVGAGVEAVLLDRRSLRPTGYLSGQGWTWGLAFSSDSSRVAASGDRLIVWDVTGGEPRELFHQDSPTTLPAFSPDGTMVYTANGPLVQAWDLTGARGFIPSRELEPLQWSPSFARISPDLSRVAYVAAVPQQFQVRSVDTGALGPLVAPGLEQREYVDVAWSPDGTTLNVTTGAPEVRTWDAATGRQLARHRLGPPRSSEGAAIAFFSADGRYLLVGTTTGRLHVLDARSLAPVRDPIRVYASEPGDEGERAVETMVPSGDGRTVYLPDRVVDYVSGSVSTYPDTGFPVRAVAPSPDGQSLLVDTGDSGVGLLDVGTRRWVRRPDAGSAGLMGATSFSADGALAASVNEGRLTWWDARDGTRLGTVTVGDVSAVAFSSDDRELLLAGPGGSVATLRLDPKSWVADACRLAGRQLDREEWWQQLGSRPYQPVCPT